MPARADGVDFRVLPHLEQGGAGLTLAVRF
jgi:hypothetical protein